MTVTQTILVAIVVWTVIVLCGRLFLVRHLASVIGDSAVTGLLWYIIRSYARLWHRVTFVGQDRLPPTHDGLIVVANHTGAVDPLLIQSGCRFWIRWMMAADMMGDELEWLWRHQRRSRHLRTFRRNPRRALPRRRGRAAMRARRRRRRAPKAARRTSRRRPR